MNLRAFTNIFHQARPKLYKTYLKDVGATSTTLAAITSEALPANVCMVRVTNTSDTAISFQAGAAAVALTSANIPAVGATNSEASREFWGSKTELDLLQFIAAGSKSASIEVYTY